MSLCGHQVSNCPVYLRARGGEVVADTAPQVSTTSSTIFHLENSFEHNLVAGEQLLDLLAVEDDVFQRCLTAQPDPTALQRSNRDKRAHLLRGLDAAADLPPRCPLFALQLLDLTHRWWSESEGSDIEEGNVHFLAAAAYIGIKLHSARYPDPAPFQLSH